MSLKIIAIDGHSSTGKSSLAKKVAKKLGYIHVDTGAMYRAITWYAIEHNLISKDGVVLTSELEASLPHIDLKFKFNQESHQNEMHLNNQNIESQIRTMQVSNLVSEIAKIPFVRTFLVRLQREMAKEIGIVMDGRDIGSVVFPDAPVKIFLTASSSVRAKRRYDELLANGQTISLEEVQANIDKRDLIDTQRSTSPLVKADDAVEINNDDLNREETLEAVMQVIKEKGLLI